MKRYVLNANNLDIVITDDFYGQMLNGVPVDNHCSPTAGTTIIKYWANRRGVSRLYHQSDWWVFSSLFVNMGTSSSSGTYESDVLSGTISYSENTRGVSISGSDFWGNSLLENRTFAKAQAYINADVPFYLNVPGHTMVCFGYYTVGGRQQVIVANGWDRIWTFTSFPALNSISFQYVRWN